MPRAPSKPRRKPAKKIDALTRRWMRCRSDEVAVEQGARFDLEAASYTVWWIERYCRLYEGKQGPLVLMSVPDQPVWDTPPVFDWSDDDTRKLYTQRCDWHLRLLESGHHLDWQYEAHMRIYGWQILSEFHQRWIRRFRDVSIFISKKNKKMNAEDTPVPTPQGWTRFGQLRVGDQVFDRHGRVCRVIQEHPWHWNDEDAFEVEFTNGERIKCNGDHLWYTEALARTEPRIYASRRTGSRTDAMGKGRRGYYPAARSTWTLARSLKRNYDGALNHRIPMHPGLELPDAVLPIDPYVLGYYLGDGSRDDGQITCHRDDLENLIRQFEAVGYRVRSIGWKKGPGTTATVTFTGLRDELKSLGVAGRSASVAKRIPRNYLRGSMAQRTALLQGLMDSDGCISRDGKCLVWAQKPGGLVLDMRELLASLGVKFSCKPVWTRPARSARQFRSYRFQFHETRDRITCFRLPRKLARQQTANANRPMTTRRSRFVHVKAIRRCDPFRSRCISVDSADGTYLVGRTMVPTHNSPTMAANAMYLGMGDGEQGSKVFLLSKTGKQVRENACRHVMEMWKRSPMIHQECKFNQNEMKLYHLPTSSIIQPLSSDNKDARQSNEGINGNTLVDETHVVDQETVDIIDRAGISRAEPLHMEFSTAGKNNSGYGRRRFDLAEAIDQSREVDIHHFAYVAAAPQDTKPEDLRNEDTLIRLAKMANPAWGHTINPAELLDDYTRSRRSTGKLRDFMMYRLNIWQQEGEPFIRARDWAACARPSMRWEDFDGLECQCGLDTSVSNDLFAFAWTFAVDGMACVWVDHWLPKQTALERLDLVDFLGWEANGWIRLLPGRVIDEDLVFEDIMARAQSVHVRSISFDPNRSKYMTRRLEEAGFTLELFRQNNREYHPHVERFERLIIGPDRETMDDPDQWRPQLCHPDNPLLNWQINHCQIDEDRYGYKRPVKPASGDYRKIDGVQAAVMSIRGLTEDLGSAPAVPSAYADPNAPWLQLL